MVGRQGRRRDDEASQAEFADTMQLSETEVEAHDLLRRHLERAIPGSRVTVLNRTTAPTDGRRRRRSSPGAP
jgi:hypothetical protein